MSTLNHMLIPDIGDFTDVPVIEIAVNVGDTVSEGDTLIVVESDKSTLDVPADCAGIVEEITVAENDLVSQGTLIMKIKVSQQPAVTTLPTQSATPTIIHTAKVRPLPTSTSRSSNTETLVYASPSVRRHARNLGVEINEVHGTGPKDRITSADVEAYVKARMTSKTPNSAVQLSSTLAALPDWPNVDYAKFGPVERTPLTRIGKISGPALARNALLIPHVTHFDKSDITELDSFRQTLNDEAQPGDAKITLLVFAIKAVVSALQMYPTFNASLDGSEIVTKGYWNIGVAADTPDGLLVPVVKSAESKKLRTIAAEIKSLAALAREGKLAPDDLQGATFTISSLGGIGGTNFTPIINAPEVAILGMPRSEIQPVWNGSSFEPRLIQPLALSFDHRVVDGVAAARFLKHVAAVLNDFRRVST